MLLAGGESNLLNSAGGLVMSEIRDAFKYCIMHSEGALNANK